MTIQTPTNEPDIDVAQELAALARLVTFARQSAKGLDLEFSVYCLDIALGSILEEMRSSGIDMNQITAAQDVSTSLDMH